MADGRHAVDVDLTADHQDNTMPMKNPPHPGRIVVASDAIETARRFAARLAELIEDRAA